MSTVKISSEQRRYLRERIDALFSHAANILNDRAIARRQEVTRQVLDDPSIAKGKEEAQKLIKAYEAIQQKQKDERAAVEEAIATLNSQFQLIRGNNIIDINNHYYERGTATIVTNTMIGVGTPLGRRIDEEMELTPEGGQMAHLKALHSEITDRLMLDYEGKTGAEILTEVQEAIQKIVAAPLSLPPAPTGKSAGKKKVKEV